MSAAPHEAVAEVVEEVNRQVRALASRLPWDDPVAAVQWVRAEEVVANDYNPNAVAHQEMRLLVTSIREDGYTQPVVVVADPSLAPPARFVVVDGFHRWTVLRTDQDLAARTHGYLPVVVLDKPPADRMASTIRHNRARGKHSVAGMSSLVFEMLMAGESDVTICRKLGMEAEELARLKHITGFSVLFDAAVQYSKPALTTAQLREKARYARAHPGEEIPSEF